MKKMIKQSCPKCNSGSVVFEGNWTGIMVSDIYAEHFWLCRCTSCDYKFKPTTKKDRVGPVDEKRNHA